MPEATLCFGNCGWFVEWYQQDDRSPLGYRVAYWYGSREDCERRKTEPAPPMLPAVEGRATDAATATGMYDH